MKLKSVYFIVLTAVAFLAAQATTGAARSSKDASGSATDVAVAQHAKHHAKPETVSGATPDIKPPDVEAEAMMKGCCCGGCGMMGGMMGKMHKGDRPMLEGKQGMMKGMMKQHMSKMMAGRDRGCKGPKAILMHAEELGLSEKQVKSIKQLAFSTKLAVIDLKAKASKEKLKLKKLLGEDASLKAIRNQLEALKNAEIDLKLKQITAGKKARDMLTGEQKNKLESMMKPGHGMKCRMSQGMNQGMMNRQVRVEIEEDE